MNTSKILGVVLASGLACGGFCATAFAGGLGDMAGGALGGGDMSSLASGSAGNAAGVIEFCVKNNYLGGDAASSMKDKLMGKATTRTKVTPAAPAAWSIPATARAWIYPSSAPVPAAWPVWAT